MGTKDTWEIKQPRVHGNGVTEKTRQPRRYGNQEDWVSKKRKIKGHTMAAYPLVFLRQTPVRSLAS